ncbi:GalNAc(5)-diNAcBac-PP-undecaprenol beta-1,3-glucosyltransferase [Rosistilla ulvae]|uniref:GalNAc(5)-diNAcBac-PP-undecaprenol beta-1,3-glucosyltransferase n=1 Tax=Rosistilla ulvae TaxID=1930277 RepID=A0A517M0D3_9BACT|nr:glycosyltransferase family 2 protein [Rosistilla ulvae]QDS88344.1 GalNAc(5)-diNAcBac-PP-undecaprenol beta-1,3-glucosyltransferase [Rosistilla ulvae]
MAENRDPVKLAPRITVIIPTFNRERWLPRSIASVQNQTFQDWELLVVDDGSTDQSMALLESFAAEDARIQVLRNCRGKGVSGARNTGIDAARGDYVAFLDSDDEWMPSHLEKSLVALDQYDGAVQACSASAERRLEATGETFGASLGVGGELNPDGVGEQVVLQAAEVLESYIQGKGPLEIQTFVIRREALGDTRFPEDLRIGEDGFFFASLADRGLGVLRLFDPHAIMWAHDANTTSAGGRQLSAHELIRLYEDLEGLGEKTLASFELTVDQRRRIRHMMAAGRFWQIGYHGHLQQKHYAEARSCFRRAMRWEPRNLRFWKTYLLSYLRQGWLR